MADDEFARSVAMGLKLSKRIIYKDDGNLSAPKPALMKTKSAFSPETYLPTAPMVYAVISKPDVVDNPDIPSYQPYVHGLCQPPALIPLHMHAIALEADCYLDTAFVTVTGTWRVHCVTASTSCDCLIAIPMGEQGSVLGVEVESTRRSYFTQLLTTGDKKDAERVANSRDGWLLKQDTYILKISEVDGGSSICVKVRWCQKLLYQDGEFCLCIPFTFPAYVEPFSKKISKSEKITLNVNPGSGTDIICTMESHSLKELRREAGKVGFSYEEQVRTWSSRDFLFSYSVCSNDIFGGLLLQTPPLHDVDQRDMFCFYLFPGSNNDMKVFGKEVVFIVDRSASMGGAPLENAKDAMIAALSKLNEGDYFNIIAFNENIDLFSSSMERVTDEAIQIATEWMNKTFIAEGSTNMILPLNQALEMVGNTGGLVPLIFLITDGAVEDERYICNAMKSHLVDGRLNTPRICTFGIGSYCNHYFLQLLADIGRGKYDAAYDVESIRERMERLFNSTSSAILANITIDDLENLQSLELYPSRLPDLFAGDTLVISGRCHGTFPDSVKARGVLADLSNFVMDVKVQKAKDIPIEKVFAKRHISSLTANAWLDQNEQLQEKVAKMSLQTGVPSEYTHMILVQNDKGKPCLDSMVAEKKFTKLNSQKIICLKNLCVGFGDLIATNDNLPPGIENLRLSEPAGVVMKAATTLWSTLLDRCCCMCFIQCCSRLNDQCAIALTQLCTALSCFECLSCCCEVCDSCNDLCS